MTSPTPSAAEGRAGTADQPAAHAHSECVGQPALTPVTGTITGTLPLTKTDVLTAPPGSAQQ
ncbi:MAG: hypothetical protein R3A10_01710 [Caldilineaceae bacterium]